MVGFVDRREFFRMTVSCEVDYLLIETGEAYKARCCTLSGAGISFVTNHKLLPKAELEMTIQPPYPLTPPMRVYAKVIRVHQLEDQSFEVAATMTVLDESL